MGHLKPSAVRLHAKGSEGVEPLNPLGSLFVRVFHETGAILEEVTRSGNHDGRCGSYVQVGLGGSGRTVVKKVTPTVSVASKPQ